MTRHQRRVVLGLAGAQLADAAFNAVGVFEIAPSSQWGSWAAEWTKEDLDRLQFPPRFRAVFPVVKVSSAAGLLIGLRSPKIGKLTAAALVAYFVVALGFHRRAGDSLDKYGPAFWMLVWSANAYSVLRRLSSES
jgi:hypothetical protein